MMHIFDGLTGYQQVLLVCGMALFVVSLIGLIVAIARGASYAGLAVLFVVSMAMMGFVRVQSISVGDATVQLNNAVGSVRTDATNPKTRANLQQVVAKLANRYWSDPTVLTKLADAQHILGQTDAAKANLAKALQSPAPPADALALQKRFQLEDSIPQLTQQVAGNPADPAAKIQLQQTLSEINQTSVANPTTLTNVAKAQSALGNQNEALTNVDKALQINPNLSEAAAVRKEVIAKIPGSGT
jgi:tetratricopeptide (TPR) repeat protein